MIIGITSFLAAGKGTMSDYLKEKGFLIYSCSDIIREECRNRHLEVTRENLQMLGNELRKEHGPNVLAKRLCDKITIEKLKGINNFVVESLRNPLEIEELKKFNDFVLVFIDTDSKIRYERAKARLREKEAIDSYEDFMVSEKKELESNDPNSQQLIKCKELSEYQVNNNTTKEDFIKQVDELLVEIQIKQRDKLSWNNYFMTIAEKLSKRSGCLCVNISAVITKDNEVVSTGYVGAPRNTKDCFEKGYCLRRKLNIPSGSQYETCVSVHAEQNAIINAARAGVSIKGGTMYIFGEKRYQNIIKPINAFPCFICKKMIINSGVEKVICSTEDGGMKIFLVKDWVEEWQKKDIVDDASKYSTKYK